MLSRAGLSSDTLALVRKHDAQKRTFAGQTENIARLALDLAHLPPDKPVTIELDGQKLGELPWPQKGTQLQLARDGEKWSATNASSADKNPKRGGPFREV